MQSSQTFHWNHSSVKFKVAKYFENQISYEKTRLLVRKDEGAKSCIHFLYKIHILLLASWLFLLIYIFPRHKVTLIKLVNVLYTPHTYSPSLFGKKENIYLMIFIRLIFLFLSEMYFRKMSIKFNTTRK